MNFKQTNTNLKHFSHKNKSYFITLKRKLFLITLKKRAIKDFENYIIQAIYSKLLPVYQDL